MTRRPRTARQHSLLPPRPHPRVSLPLLAGPPVLTAHPLVRSIVEELLAHAEHAIEGGVRAGQRCHSLLASLDCGLQNLHRLEQVAFEPHCLASCESEPLPSGSSRRPSEATRHQVGGAVGRGGKEKWQSCDIGEWRREKGERVQPQQYPHNGVVSLLEDNRATENEDQREEIQSLLRRKKELRLQSKQLPRSPSQTTRPALLERKEKEKKFFGQDDDGEAFELVSNQLKLARETAPAIQLGNVKVMPGQQVAFPSTLKRRPIVELPTRKTKRRKEVGDTCVFIEQLYEADAFANQETVIEQACRVRQGVRFAPKDKSITSVIRLPAIR